MEIRSSLSNGPRGERRTGACRHEKNAPQELPAARLFLSPCPRLKAPACRLCKHVPLSSFGYAAGKPPPKICWTRTVKRCMLFSIWTLRISTASANSMNRFRGRSTAPFCKTDERAKKPVGRAEPPIIEIEPEKAGGKSPFPRSCGVLRFSRCFPGEPGRCTTYETRLLSPGRPLGGRMPCFNTTPALSIIRR